MTRSHLSKQLARREGCSLKEALAFALQHIASASARLDAELLLLAVIKQSRVYLYSHSEASLSGQQLAEYGGLIERRCAGEPVAHILGYREFWSLPFKVTAATLIPRPETEKLVELALELALPEQAEVLDLGSGTGAIACALAAEKNQWSILATEKSDDALGILKQNVRNLVLHNVAIQQSDWFQALAQQRFELIVSNPPYVASDDAHLERGDLRFEPRSALVSGSDGLADIRHIVGNSGKHLKSGGWLLIEHGYNQGGAVSSLMTKAGFAGVRLCQDYCGHDRVTLGQWW